jgi:bisphosphoglycerate-independent phosphoglycerate mutase (AlkP superfamily)
MKTAKLFSKLRALIEDTQDVDKKHIKKIRKVLQKLKKQQHELRDRLNGLDNTQERQRIEQEIQVITLQRQKGAEVYKRLRQERKKAKSDAPVESPDSADNAPGHDT